MEGKKGSTFPEIPPSNLPLLYDGAGGELYTNYINIAWNASLGYVKVLEHLFWD